MCQKNWPNHSNFLSKHFFYPLPSLSLSHSLYICVCRSIKQKAPGFLFIKHLKKSWTERTVWNFLLSFFYFGNILTQGFRPEKWKKKRRKKTVENVQWALWVRKSNSRTTRLAYPAGKVLWGFVESLERKFVLLLQMSHEKCVCSANAGTLHGHSPSFPLYFPPLLLRGCKAPFLMGTCCWSPCTKFPFNVFAQSIKRQRRLSIEKK